MQYVSGLSHGYFTLLKLAIVLCLAVMVVLVFTNVVLIINNSIGLITPPVGVVLNVVCGVSKISMDDLITGVWPFMIAELIVLALMVFFPRTVTVPASWGHA